MRKNLTIPPVEALKRAFRSVKCLTEYDAVILANDASGVTGHFTSLIRRLSGSLTRRPQPWSNLTAGLVAKSAWDWIVLFNCQVSAGVGARRIWAGRLARKAWTFFRSACKASW